MNIKTNIKNYVSFYYCVEARELSVKNIAEKSSVQYSKRQPD